MKKLLLVILLFVLLIPFFPRGFKLFTDKDYYGYPAITNCRVCDKTIWAWEDYERVNFITDTVDNFMIVNMSGFIHKDCKDRDGLPIVSDIVIKVDASRPLTEDKVNEFLLKQLKK